MIPFIVFGALAVLLLLFFVGYVLILAAEDAKADEPWAPGHVTFAPRLELQAAARATDSLLERASAILGLTGDC